MRSATACGSPSALTQWAGSIQWAAAGQHVEFTIAKKPLPKSTQVPLWFELLLNSVLSTEARYVTLVHQLAHLYCGHLGTPNARWWPVRKSVVKGKSVDLGGLRIIKVKKRLLRRFCRIF